MDTEHGRCERSVQRLAHRKLRMFSGRKGPRMRSDTPLTFVVCSRDTCLRERGICTRRLHTNEIEGHYVPCISIPTMLLVSVPILLLACLPGILAVPVLPPTRPNSTHLESLCRPRPLWLLRQQLNTDFDNQRMSVDEPVTQRRRLRHGKTIDGYFVNSSVPYTVNTTQYDYDSRQSLLERIIENARQGQTTNRSVAGTTSQHTASTPLPSVRVVSSTARSSITSSPTTATPVPPASRSQLPWHCDMQMVWKKMAPGVFPPYVQTGRCVQRTCMFGACECTPRKYVIKLLRRVPRACNPLPTLDENTVYEEAWTVSKVRLTVFCECTRKRRRTDSSR